MKCKPRIDGAIYERGYVYDFHFLLVWVTRYSQKLFTPELASEMKEILIRIAAMNDVTIESIAVNPSHVLLELSFKPKCASTDIVKALKGGSARLFLAKHPEIKSDPAWDGHIWSKSYYMATLGERDDAALKTYIENECTK